MTDGAAAAMEDPPDRSAVLSVHFERHAATAGWSPALRSALVDMLTEQEVSLPSLLAYDGHDTLIEELKKVLFPSMLKIGSWSEFVRATSPVGE